MLAQGGNAFDAAAATAAALNVVEPFMSGLAGAGLATCYVAAEKRVRVLDFVPPVPPAFRSSASAGARTCARVRCRQAPRQPRRMGRAGARARQASRWATCCAGHRAGARRLSAGRSSALRRSMARGRCSRRYARSTTSGRRPIRAARARCSRASCCAARSGAHAEGARRRGGEHLYGGALGRDHCRASGEARRLPDHGRSRAMQAGVEGAAHRDLSRPDGANPAAAVRGLPVPADAAHPRRLRSREAWSATASSTSTRCGAPSALRRACASPTTSADRRSLPSCCRTRTWRSCAHACATASRSRDRPSSGWRRRRAARRPRATPRRSPSPIARATSFA